MSDNALAQPEHDEEHDTEVERQEPRAVSLDARKLVPQKAGIILNRIVQDAHFAKDMLAGVIDAPAATEYVLRITPEIQKGLDSGEYKLMRRETGEVLCAVTRKAEGSNRQVIAKRLDAVERTVPVSDPSKQTDAITADLYDIAIQQQLAELSAQLQDALDGIKRIEQGQQDDRFALIESAERELRLAAVAEDEDNRIEAIRSARHFLQDGTAKISKAMARRLQEVEGVPDALPAITWKMISTRGNYYDEMNEWFNGIQESFEVLEKAHALLSLCVIAIGEPKMLDVVFEDYSRLLADMDTQKLLSMGNIHRDADFTGEWFFDTEEYVRAKHNDVKALTDGECIDVTITGEMLLEAMEDEAGEGTDGGAEEPLQENE